MNKYKSSFYNIYFTTDDEFYVYNTLSTAIGQIDENVYDYLRLNKLEKISTETLDTMLEQGFVVDKELDEKMQYLYFYNRVRYGGSAKLLSITLIPTYACNLACPYCLEGNDKKSEMITREQVNAILKFAENEIIFSRSHGVSIEKINACLYGGEPMMHKKAIIYFMDKMNSLAHKYNCKIENFMTSNFTLVDNDMLDMIEKYKITTQITIDGTRETHNKRRITKTGAGTYDIILKNMERMKQRGINESLSIRINIDEDNLDQAEDIIREVGTYSVDTYFGLLKPYNGLNDEYKGEYVSQEVDNREKTIVHLNKIMRKYNHPVPEEFGKLAPCSMGIENKWHIDAYLNVYKCELGVNHEELKVGVLTPDGEFVPNANFYRQITHSPERIDKCLKCERLPLCGGGCTTEEYIKQGRKDANTDIPECMCSREGLIYYLKDYVKRLKAQ